MIPAEVRDLSVSEYLAMVELMDRDMKERKRQQRKPRKR